MVLVISRQNGMGNETTFAQMCTGTCYNDYVIWPPATYDTYFEIRSICTYHNPSRQGVGQHAACGSAHSGEHAGSRHSPKGSPGGRMFVVAWMVFGRHAAHGPAVVLQAPIIANRKFPYYSRLKHQTHAWLGAASYHTEKLHFLSVIDPV